MRLTARNSIIGSIVFMAMCLVLSSFSAAHGSEPTPSKLILFTIGYADQHEHWSEKIGFGSYTYHPSLGLATEARVVATLKILGFKNQQQESNSSKIESFSSQPIHQIFSHPVSDIKVVLLNSNVKCPGEPNGASISRRYRRECGEQQRQSKAVADFVRERLFQFDAFFYIGHSRGGQGLSFGNFNDEEARVSLHSTALHYLGKSRLSFAFLGSCLSESYYGDAFRLLYHGPEPRVVTLPDTQDWFYKIVPTALEQLQAVVRDLRPDEIESSRQKRTIHRHH